MIHENPMPKTREQKTATVAELKDAFASAKSAMFVDYQGLKVPDVTALRKELTGAGVRYVVAKKTLLSLAAKQAGYDIDFRKLPGMLGVALAVDDEMAAAKLIGDAAKKEKPVKLVGGIFEGKVVDQAYAVALSKLPSKKELYGQVLRVMQGPASAFVRLLNARKEKLEVTP
jgi:large subunit ribosomal protein L10